MKGMTTTRIYRFLLLLAALWAGLSGCNKPREIPDEKLAPIMAELFLANAYSSSSMMPDSLRFDSVDLYSPIFRRYGFRPTDFTHTIRNLTKRKSIRLSQITEQATLYLQAEAEGYIRQVALLDTLDAIGASTFADTVYRDSLRRIQRVSQLEEGPDITLPLSAGRYQINFIYLIDTADRNGYIQYLQYVLDTAETKSQQTYRSFPKGSRRHEELTLDVTDPARFRSLNIFLAYSSSKNREKTVISVDSMCIIHYLPRAVALDSLDRRVLYPYTSPNAPKPFADEPASQDFVTLRVDSAGLAPLADTLLRRAGEAR